MVDATRDLILNCDDIELKPVIVQGWKDKKGNPLTVYIKQFSAKDGEEYLNNVDADGNVKKNQQLKAIATSICDAQGVRLFTKDDVDALANKNFNVLSKLAAEVMRVNFANVDMEQEAKN